MFKLSNLFKSNKRNFSQPDANNPPQKSCPTQSQNQRQATQEIISDTPLSSDLSIQELNNNAKERSDRLYNERQQRVAKFNPFNITVNPSSSVCLTSTEKYFLKQMHGQNVDNPTVYAYWTYEYAIDFETIMTKLLMNGYLQISNSYDVLSTLTVVELKSILQKYGFSLTGKKADLITRIKENISLGQLSSALENKKRIYLLTDRGKECTTNLPTSMTKNLELEDSCLNLIYSKQFNDAYKLVCENEVKKIIPRGIGIDWNRELTQGLSDFKITLFSDFYTKNLRGIPSQLQPYTDQIKACVIIGILFGTDARKITNLFIRITPPCSIPKSELTSILQSLQFRLLDSIQAESLRALHS